MKLTNVSKVRIAVTLGAVAIAALVLLFIPQPDSVEAHANQIRSLPAPDSELDVSPDRVVVWFSEEIEASLSEVRVLDELAREVDNGDSALSPTEPTALIATLPTLENGTYTVVWRNLSTVDGHRVVGSFRFAVGEPLSTTSVVPLQSQPLIQSGADPWLRWVFLIGALGFAGVLFFDLMVTRPALRSDEKESPSGHMIRHFKHMMSRIMQISVALMLFGLIALLIQQASITFEVNVFQVFGDPLSSVLGTEWGRLWIWRIFAVIIAGLLGLLAIKQASPADADEGESDSDNVEAESEQDYEVAFTETVPGALALAASLAVLGLTSLSSHNAAVPVEVRTPAVISDFIHLVSASAWVGGLFLLALAVPTLLRRSETPADSKDLLSLMKRFTPLAFVSAGTLIVTGIFAGYMQVTVPVATNTPYGWALVAKIVLLIPLFGFAAVNSYMISRRVLQAGKFQFRKLVRGEAIIAILLLAAVGWLIGLEPARQFAGRNGIGVEETVSFSDFTEGTGIDVELDPGDVGQNSVTVNLADRRGDPITNANDVRVRLKFLEDDLGEPLISLEDQGNGVWSLDDFRITIGGVYQVEVRVVRPDAFDAFTSFRFDASPASVASDAIRPTRTATWTLFAVVLLVIGGLIMVAGLPVMKEVVTASRTVAVSGAALSVVGVALLLNAQVFRAGFPEDRFNPFPLNSESIELGNASYVNTCAACHGDTGLGDGPQAASLSSPPADLSVHVPLHTDSEIFGFIRDGIPGTEMPGQAGILTDEEMWHLVNYLRTFED